MFDAILFDNDGVLVDTEHLYFRANQEALAGVGIDLDAAAYVELFLREGRGPGTSRASAASVPPTSTRCARRATAATSTGRARRRR